jgi:hypothetical protein
MSDNDYLTFLLLGTLFVVIDGQILYRGGRQYLATSNAGAESEGSMGRMVAVVFHLVCLGLLALLSLVNLGGTSTAAIVGRLGVFLLLMALAHAVTLSVLSRQRESHVLENRLGTQQQGPSGQNARVNYAESTVDPVPGQAGAAPTVSPDLDQRGPYTA